MVPNHSGRTKSEYASALSHPPANVYIVARLAKLRVKTSDGFQPTAPEGHVAARDMFRFRIGKEHVCRSAWRSRNAVRGVSIVQEGNVRPTHTCIASFEERGSEVGQPIRVGTGVVVNVRNDFAASGLPA